MILSCKRPSSWDDLMDPLAKRLRLGLLAAEGGLGVDGESGAEAEMQARLYAESLLSAASAASTISGAGDRRRPRSCCDEGEQGDEEAELQDDKRPRTDCGGSSSASASASCDLNVQAWSRTLVQALKGCPSLDEATTRCAGALADFEAEVREAALRDAADASSFAFDEAARGASSGDDCGAQEALHEEVQGLQHKNRVLMRAVHHLAERCRNLEARGSDVAELRQALEQSQEAQRRLTHSNEVLQGHLRVHLDSCGPAAENGHMLY
eukprot:TRINITY_DN2966_c1_g4_i1.p1 TRINITY_DN2966_c1_g4~~TRINITY_DN2966_c1_g4_i1.p1  ORF type:complete len:267 (+),score=78.80 TRINITY_DN2966_c1_g4_i1:94-894(+)